MVSSFAPNPPACTTVDGMKNGKGSKYFKESKQTEGSGYNMSEGIALNIIIL
jgi:hypothetical protein